MSAFLIMLIFLSVRLSSVFIVQTFFVPDEYWQSLEVAHNLVFGYGHLTWEWKEGIRTYLYPLPIAAVYKLLQLLNIDTVDLLVTLPRVIQALLSAYADYRFYIWAGRRKWAVFTILTSYFWFYTASRTLTNTVETCLTTIALSYFAWHDESTIFLWFVGLCCYIRPTAALEWIPICLYHLKKTNLPIGQLIVKRYFTIGLLVLCLGVAVDSYFYGKFVVTPWEFLKHNYLFGIGSFYGTHPWYWYFKTGLTTVLGINFVPFLYGVVETIRHSGEFTVRKVLLIAVLLTLMGLSTVEHKEFRFILCLLPMCLYICADCLSRWSHKASRLFLWIVATALFIGNMLPCWYLSVVHQRGTLDVMPHLAKIAREYKDENNNRASILFLMPCHSTPFYSHIHENITMRFLTCEPNLRNVDNYIDEADNFYKAPDKWLRSHMPVYPKSALPTHLVLFDSLPKQIPGFLNDYNVILQVPHAEISSERVGKSVLVYQRYNTEEKNNWVPEDSQDKLQPSEDAIENVYENEEL